MTPLEYTLTEQDLLAFHLYYASHAGTYRRQARRQRWLVPACYLIFALIVCGTESYGLATAFALFAVAWFFLAPRWVRRRYRRHYERHIRDTAGDSLREPMTLELLPDRIATTSCLGECRYRYAAVDCIVENAGYTYIFIGKAQAIILPHDRVPKAAVDELVAEIGRKRGAHAVP